MHKLLVLVLTLFSFFTLKAASSLPALQTLQLSSAVKDLVWDATRARYLVAVDGAILTVDPERVSVDGTLAVGEAIDKIAISDDGQYVYALINARGAIKRYRIRDNTLDLEMSLGHTQYGYNRTAKAIAVVPGQPRSVLVAFAYADGLMAVYDDAVSRSAAFALEAISMYARPDTGLIYTYDDRQIHSIKVDSSGITLVRSTAAHFAFETIPCWSGKFVTDREGRVFDLDAGAIIGHTGYADGNRFAHDAIVDAAGSSIVAVVSGGSTAELAQYSLTTFRAIASAPLTPEENAKIGYSHSGLLRSAWGRAGILIANGEFLNFIHLGTLAPLPPPEAIVLTTDASGVIHVPLAGTALAFDERRGVIWAAVAGTSQSRANMVVAINARNGMIEQAIEAASPVSSLAVSGDGSHLFALQGHIASVATFSLETLGRTSTIQPAIKSSPASLAPVPGRADSVAVVWRTPASLYTTQISVYDNGIARPRSVSTAVYGREGIKEYITGVYPGDTDNSLYGVDLEMNHGDNEHDLVRLVVDSDGIAFDKSLTALKMGAGPGRLGHSIVYDGGTLFTAAGEMWTPDTQSLLGTFSLQQTYATNGYPVPFAGDNRVAFVHTSDYLQDFKVTLFEISTQRPLATMALPGFNAVVRAGAGTMAVSTGSEILLIPLTSLQPWPEPTPFLHAVSPGVQRLNMKVAAITARPHTSDLVVVLPGAAGAQGNSVAVLNTTNGHIERSAYAGSEPAFLRTTVDGSTAYVYLSGEQRVARINLASGTRDLVFVPDPTGQGRQYPLSDMVLGPDESLTASYGGGWLATFDRGELRPRVDKNTSGPGAYGGSSFRIVLNSEGTILYANDDVWSSNTFKRVAIEADGVHYLSGAVGLVGNGRMAFSGGLIFTSHGRVIDPERSRHVGQFQPAGYSETYIAPDLEAGRIYAISGNELTVFDSGTYTRIAWMRVGEYNTSARSLVRYGSEGLAFHTTTGEIYLVHIPSIPLLANPIPTEQPSLPVTEGVLVTDLKAGDLAYDAARDLLYASIPNSEAANGDQIVALDPANGSVTARWRARTNPNLLALSTDGSRLFFTFGAEHLAFYSEFSPMSEQIAGLDLASGAISEGYPVYPYYPGVSFGVRDMVTLPEQPDSIAVVDFASTSAAGWTLSWPNSLRVYDNGTARPKYLLPHTFTCGSLLAGEHWSQLYCSDGSTISRLAVDEQGVSVRGTIRLLPGKGKFGRMVHHQGRIYTTTGNVVDAGAGRVIRRVNTQGPVAVDGGRVYWLEPGTNAKTVILRAFDIGTLQPLAEKIINVTDSEIKRLVACGNSRLAFQAGQEIYIVTP